jgi:ribulose-5-phosphate 4-epimerase/fuculose-1-phosphate aldolase
VTAVEGVVKFVCGHTRAPLAESGLVRLPPLLAWRRILWRLGLIGRDPARYGGAAFGNVSARVPPFPGERGARRFVITCTQTGHLESAGAESMAVVETYDAERNAVTSRGPCEPSSEALTHGAIYDVDPRIRCVLHVHAPSLWRAAERLRLPCTPGHVPYGTPEMAFAVARLYRATDLATTRVLAMLGHEDGVVSFGRDEEEAGVALISALARAEA